MNRFLLPIVFLFTVSFLHAQDYFVSSTFLGTKTKLDLLLTFGLPVEYDVDMYKITYRTPGTDNLPDTASGLIVLPKVAAGTLLPIVVYGHGTTDGPNDVPSKLAGGYELALAYAAYGFITVAPDYLGLGDSRGFHPYVHAGTEASASFDMLNSTLEFLPTTTVDWDPAFLFLTGYSQGGHASMALHQELETVWSFSYPVTAATHMSGPYSLSGVMKNLILSDVAYGNPAYIAYIFLGMNEVYDLWGDVSTYFKETYVDDIIAFQNGDITLGVLNGRLLNSLQSTNGSPKNLIQDDVLNEIINNPDHPVNLALLENDTYNWVPNAPTRLYYCGMDGQVPFENALVAEAAMNLAGAADVQAVNQGANLDHGPCVIPSAVASIQYFRSFLEVSSSKGPASIASQIDVYPSPATDFIYIGTPLDETWSQVEFSIYNMQGELVKSGNARRRAIDIADLSAGIYTLTCTKDNELRYARFVRL